MLFPRQWSVSFYQEVFYWFWALLFVFKTNAHSAARTGGQLSSIFPGKTLCILKLNNENHWLYRRRFMLWGCFATLWLFLCWEQVKCFVWEESRATRWTAAGRRGVPGLSVAETAAGVSGAERGPVLTPSPGMEVRPASDQHKSIKNVTSPLVQVKSTKVQTCC